MSEHRFRRIARWAAVVLLAPIVVFVLMYAAIFGEKTFAHTQRLANALLSTPFGYPFFRAVEWLERVF
jgi:hypothetical protein